MRPLPAVTALLFAFSLQAQQVTTVAGRPGVAGLMDGPAAVAAFNRPTWLDLDAESGALYVVDRENDAVRKLAGGAVSTVLFKESVFAPSPKPIPLDFDGPLGGGIAVEPPYGGCGGSMYAHGIFLSTTGQHRLTFVADFGWGAQYASRDDSSPLIGTGSPGASDGDQLHAQFSNPGDVALSWGYAGSGGTFLTDRLYVADSGNHTIRRIRFRLSLEYCSQPYFVETEAGVAGQPGSSDGRPDEARFNAPRGVVAAPDGSIYVADTGNHTIRRIAANGVTTVAGQAGTAGWADGAAGASRLHSPSGIDVDADGTLYIADSGNQVIRRLSPDGTLTTIAGTPGVAGWADGPARSALFAGPVGVRVVGDKVYVADTSNHVIRAVEIGPPSPPRRRAVRH